jgi:hypothetical protein
MIAAVFVFDAGRRSCLEQLAQRVSKLQKWCLAFFDVLLGLND